MSSEWWVSTLCRHPRPIIWMFAYSLLGGTFLCQPPWDVPALLLEDVADDALVVDERDYTHLVSAAGTGKRIGFVHLFDESRPGGSRRTARGTLLDEGKRVALRSTGLLAPGAVGIIHNLFVFWCNRPVKLQRPRNRIPEFRGN